MRSIGIQSLLNLNPIGVAFVTTGIVVLKAAAVLL